MARYYMAMANQDILPIPLDGAAKLATLMVVNGVLDQDQAAAALGIDPSYLTNEAKIWGQVAEKLGVANNPAGQQAILQLLR